MNSSIESKVGGSTVGPYRILEELGRGGMGRVYRVEHTITRRLEAMKVLEGGRPETPDQAARSLREIQLQASLDHPHIAAVHNAFWQDEDLVLVMELIEGSSLRRLMETGRIPLAQALDYACQVLSALSYAHAHGIIHRDVSPGNMMVSSNGVLKLTDFGLAKGPGDVRLSQTGAPLGSLYYMSPEQVRDPAAADPRSDIYSLGAVLYELTAGRRPFEGESAFEIMVKQVEQAPVPPAEIEPRIPDALNRAILRSLEKDPARRFASADEFREFLLRIADQKARLKPFSRASLPGFLMRTAGVLLVSLSAVFLSNDSPVKPVQAAPAVYRAQEPAEPRQSAPASAGEEKPQSSPPIRAARKRKSGPNRIAKTLRKLWPGSWHKRSSSD